MSQHVEPYLGGHSEGNFNLGGFLQLEQRRFPVSPFFLQTWMWYPGSTRDEEKIRVMPMFHMTEE